MTKEKKIARVQVVMAPSEVERIDDWGFKHRIRSRSEVVRRLLLAGLEAMERAEKRAEKDEGSRHKSAD